MSQARYSLTDLSRIGSFKKGSKRILFGGMLVWPDRQILNSEIFFELPLQNFSDFKNFWTKFSDFKNFRTSKIFGLQKFFDFEIFRLQKFSDFEIFSTSNFFRLRNFSDVKVIGLRSFFYKSGFFWVINMHTDTCSFCSCKLGSEPTILEFCQNSLKIFLILEFKYFRNFELFRTSFFFGRRYAYSCCRARNGL